MGRPRRQLPAGTIVHAYNRRVDRHTIFHEPRDYRAFMDMVQEGLSQELVRIFGYCLMPNHWHFVMQAQVDQGISEFIKWLTVTHVHRYRKWYGTVGHGHLYQARFKSPVIEGEAHFLTVMRYVETNAAVANLVQFPMDWPWSSAFERGMRHRAILSETPTPLPPDWGRQLVAHVEAYRASIQG